MRLPLETPTTAETSFDLRPSKIVAVGVNYKAHAAEFGKEVSDEPLIFFKPPSALIGSGDVIVRPPDFKRVDYEGELGVVIGTKARFIVAANALEHVLGYVCVNDVSIRELQKKDGQWARAKGFDTFCPVGPKIVGGLDPSNLRITTRLNGETRQSSSTSDMIFDVPTIIAFVSRVMTLEVGDLITTGTPSGVGPMAHGDTVEVEIEGIGVLRNTVAEERPRP